MYKQKSFFLFLNFFFMFEAFGFQVIIDQSNDQAYSAFDTGFAGLSQFTEIVYQKKGHVWQNYRPLEEVLPQLKGDTLVVLGVSLTRNYKVQTINALESYVKSGGHLLVLVEHDNFLNNARKQNQLLKRFGVKAYYGKARANEKNWKKHIWPVVKSPLFQLNNIRVFLPAPLKYEGNNKTLLKIKNPLNKSYSVVGTINEDQKGRVIVLGDMEILWNMQKDTGINYGDNRAFFKKLLGHLFTSQKDQKLTFNKGGKKNLFVYTCQNAMELKDTLGSVTKLAQSLNKRGYNISSGCHPPKDSIVLITAPIKKLPKWSKEHRLILIADGQSDDLKNKTFKSIMKEDLKLKITDKDYDYPLNETLTDYGLRVGSESLAHMSEPSFITDGQLMGSSVSLKRSAVLINQSEDNETLGLSQKSHALSHVVPQNDDFSKAFEKNEMPKQYPFLIKNKRVFLISDLELVNNQFYHLPQAKIIEGLIADWL